MVSLRTRITRRLRRIGTKPAIWLVTHQPGSIKTGLPPGPVGQAFRLLPEGRRKVYEYYRLAFTRAGCPMKATPRGLAFHPIFAPYLINEFLILYRRLNDPICLEAAQTVADHALRFGTTTDDTLTFRYDPKSRLTSFDREFYSALTQAWYLRSFCDLFEVLPGRYDAVIPAIFRSLLVPIESGGVLLRKPFGWIVEEYPHDPPLYTLNGWLTTLRWVYQCTATLDSLGVDYQEFLDRNLDAAEHLLPLYDAKFCLNTRYQLAGFTRIRLSFDPPVQHEVEAFGIEIPTDGYHAGHLSPRSSRWQNYLATTKPAETEFNVVLSLISKPHPNVLTARLILNAPSRVTVQLAQGSYRWDLTAMPTETWRSLDSFDLTPGTSTAINCPLPFDGIDMFAYPTNFKKFIGGTNYNGYHFVHIVDLAELYARSGRRALRDTCVKWLDYVDGWQDLPFLTDPSISLESHAYRDRLRGTVEQILARAH